MPAGLIPRILKKLLKGRMELFLDIESGIFRNRTGDENMNLCGVRLVRRQDVPVSLSFLGRELEAGRVTLAAYHKKNGQLLAYQEEQITGGAVAMVVDFDTQEIRAAAKEAEDKTIEAQVAVLVETEEGKGVYHSLPLNFYLEPGLIGDEHLPNSARPEWEMMYETVLERAEEAEGYAGSAWASKRAAADSATAADTSATNAARDAKSANDAKTAVESLAATWPETVSDGKRQIIEARNEAVTAIQDKQAAAVLAVGRASQTAQQNIASAQVAAVSAVQAAGKEAKETIEPLVQRAETAREDIDQAERRINTAATNAANSATSAGNSATAAANALAAIPQVDESGNMTLPGNITAAGGTFDGAVNANGGINIPLAVGAATDTTAVNRMYAAGMAGVTGILTSNAFLNTDAITASGSSTVTKTVPYHLAGIKIPKGTHSTIQAKFEVSNPQWNYSSFAGFSFLWRATNAAKLSFGIGRGTKTIRPDLSIDSYSIIPANGLAYNHGEILDITFDNVRNTERNGYTVRVREIFALNNTDSWQVKTTTSFIPASQNEPVPWTVCKVVYQQKSVASIARYEDTGALWLMLTGGQGYNLYQIATCRGVSNFETGVGISSWVTDVVNNAGGDVSVYAGIGEYTYYQPGGMNPVFYSLEAMSVNAIESEETAGFEDINVPLES
ncbi:MAG: hypothetical protein MSH56_06315 [Akkermansia muciniphila]|nr:hypothetical protein [Akkermansia muciniphila]